LGLFQGEPDPIGQHCSVAYSLYMYCYHPLVSFCIKIGIIVALSNKLMQMSHTFAYLPFVMYCGTPQQWLHLLLLLIY